MACSTGEKPVPVGRANSRVINAKVVEAPPTFDRTLVLDLMRLADDSESEIRSYLESGRLFLLIEDINAQPIGELLAMQTDDQVTEIKSLAISVHRQHQGLGRKLVEKVVQRLLNEGTNRIIVSTSTADLENIAFYQKVGFRCLSIERDAFTDSKDYPEHTHSQGIPLRDRIWFDLCG